VTDTAARLRACGHPDTPENQRWATNPLNGKRARNGCRECGLLRSRASDERRLRARGGRPRKKARDFPEGMKECVECDRILPLDAFYRRTGRDGGYTQGRKPRCISCEREKALSWERANMPHVLQRNREYLARVRWTALVHYSSGDEPECACCGETELVFLALDHVRNDGADHRRELAEEGRGASLARELARQGWPEGYQVLCSNCNWAKHVLGACPHAGGLGRMRANRLRAVSARPIKFRKFAPSV
jgi:hypothetical protein